MELNEMSTELLGIIISSVMGVVAAAITSHFGNKREREKDRIAEALREQRQELKFQEIDKKLSEHNGYAQKFSDMHDTILKQGEQLRHIEEMIKHGTK